MLLPCLGLPGKRVKWTREMGSGQLRPASCHVPTSFLAETRGSCCRENTGRGRVEYASSKDPPSHCSRFVMPWMAFCSALGYQQSPVVVQVV